MAKQEKLIVLVLFLAAFGLRVVGLDWGYFHGDERINDAARVLTGVLVPGQHFYPPLFNYINAVALAGLFVVGLFLDWWQSAGGFREAYFADPTPFYLTARGITAVFGALVAPLFYCLARELRQPVSAAVVIAVLGALAPASISFSYIAKGDTPLSAMLVLTVLFFVRKVKAPERAANDVLLGAAACLAISFKQSVILFLAPLLVAHMALLWPRCGAGQYFRGLGRSLLAILVIWPVLNIGIILDFANFMDYQKIQAVMSVQEGASFLQGVLIWIGLATHLNWGIGWVFLLGFAAYPLILLSRYFRAPFLSLHFALWLVTASGLVITLFLVRERQPEHLWIGPFLLMQFLASFGLVEVARHAGRALSVAISGLLAASLAVSVVALGTLWSQTRAVPVSRDLSEVLLARYGDAKILTQLRLDLPQHPDAIRMEHDRVQRLARKYGVTLPEEAGHERIGSSADAAVFWVSTPAVMFGLEAATDEDLAGIIKPHAWPPQAEEWELDYWLDRGFTIVVVSNLAYMTGETPSELFRRFYSEVAARCVSEHSIAPRKPLFLERRIDIFRCRPDG